MPFVANTAYGTFGILRRNAQLKIDGPPASRHYRLIQTVQRCGPHASETSLTSTFLILFLKMPVAATMATIASSFHPALPASSKFRNSNPFRKSRSTKTLALSSNPPAQYLLAKDDLLSLVADQERGVKTQGNPSTRSKIIKAIEALAAVGKDTVTTDASLLSATWRMLWTTEKEQLFIIKNAPVFGTQAGDVLQVIDVEKGRLNNVITFPPSGVFFVRSTIVPAPPQRVNFQFTSAVLRGKDWEFPLPPFGQGW